MPAISTALGGGNIGQMVENMGMIMETQPPGWSRPDSGRTGSDDLLSQRTRTVTSSCYACNTPLTLACERRRGAWVVYCTRCGVVRPPSDDLVRQPPFTFFS